MTKERMRLKYAMKTTIEGTFANLYVNEFVSPLTLFSFPDIAGVSNFLAETISMNLSRGTMQLKLVEIGQTEAADYSFKYLYSL